MRAYQDMVYSTAARLTANEAQAEDIAQEVFVRAFERFAQLRHSAGAGGWLKTVATHLALNYLSRYRRRWRLFSELARADGSAAGGAAGDEWVESDPAARIDADFDEAFAQLSAEQRRHVVDAALRRLPEHQRVPLVLYHFEELSYEQIARQLRVSLAKVKSDMHRARAALLGLLRSQGLSLEQLS